MGVCRQRLLRMGSLAICVRRPCPVHHRADSASSRAELVGFGFVHLRFCLGHSRRPAFEPAGSASRITHTRAVFYPVTRLSIRTVVATLSGISWLFAATSLVVSITFLWRTYQATQLLLVRAGLAGRGHCWLCGMSHSFRCIWHGDLHAAASHNPHSLALFASMLLGCASIATLWIPPLQNRPNQSLQPTAGRSDV